MVDPAELLRGWDLGTISEERARRTVYLPGRALCGVCGRSIADQEWRLFGTCEFWKCRIEHRRKQRELQKRREEEYRLRRKEYRRRRKEFSTRMRPFRDEVAVSRGIGEPEVFVPVAVPAAERPISPLPKERLSALADHLTQLVGHSGADREESAPHRRNDGTPTAAGAGDCPRVSILEQACALCQGYCCLCGEDPAYLDGKVMSGYLDQYSEYAPSEVIRGFLSFVPENTCKDSCVYHGEEGCGLPREMRSSVCNGFECVELRWLREVLSGSDPYRVFLIGMQGHRVVRCAFVQAADVHRDVRHRVGEER